MCGPRDYNVFSKWPASSFELDAPGLKQHNVRKKSKKVSSSILTSTPIKEILEEREKQKEKQEALRKQRREEKGSETKKGVKKLKLISSRPKSIKSRPNSPVVSTSKDGVIRCPACEEEYCDPPIEEWIQCFKCRAVA
ncbi:uncharacterized protein TNCV_1742621 [Trichonephila clavipes]|nr:uncharacterized protein TNCV_1742621 [Trichonephila clavipes]